MLMGGSADDDRQTRARTAALTTLHGTADPCLAVGERTARIPSTEETSEVDV